MVGFGEFPQFDLPRITPAAVIDILAVAFLIYQFLAIIRGRRAQHIITGIGLVIGIYAAAVVFHLGLLRTMLRALAPYTGFALIVMFQSELRRLLGAMGRRPYRGMRDFENREAVQEIMAAVARLSAERVGALIVLERKVGLRTFIESGISLDAVISRDLLCSIFQPRGALHDGAAIVQRDRVVAAACFLPLTTNALVARTLGSRHRAAIGVTEEGDCISVVVSEGTGRISVAVHGEMESDPSPLRLEDVLTGTRLHRLTPLSTEPLASHERSLH